ncbi:MAG: DUF3823 domain-containing protein [Prevotellaceae bacterium]|jgi:hypothetical protein|nr:DUF3823 domain-containing protein [Prevotellaceae bacterium]
MKARILFVSTFVCLLFAGCEYDNFDEPGAVLSGRVVYNGNPVGVRTNGTQLELWQTGYQLYTKISVHIAHDGTFSASVFDGQYKIVRLAGAPWEDQWGDTIMINVNGNTVVDVPVKPYFIVRNESFRMESGAVTARLTIEKIVEAAEIQSVNLYLGKSVLTDQNRHEKVAGLNLSDYTAGSEATITAEIPENMKNDAYVFARIGVRSTLSNEFYYTQVLKVNLK